MMDQVKVFSEYFTPKSIKRLNYELLMVTANERYGNLQIRENRTNYPEIKILRMELGEVCGDTIETAYLPIAIQVKGYKHKSLACKIPVVGSHLHFEVNHEVVEVFPESSLLVLKTFFKNVFRDIQKRSIDFDIYGYDESRSHSER